MVMETCSDNLYISSVVQSFSIKFHYCTNFQNLALQICFIEFSLGQQRLRNIKHTMNVPDVYIRIYWQRVCCNKYFNAEKKVLTKREV